MVFYTDRVFIENHDKKPRGRGYWAFLFDKEEQARWYPPMDSNRMGLLYSDAKKQAIADAIKLGAKKVSLLS